jgi:hypothetical protein
MLVEDKGKQMLDLYWKFAAWGEQPLALTNWIAFIFYALIVAFLHQIGKMLNEIHTTIVKIANRFLEEKENI